MTGVMLAYRFAGERDVPAIVGLVDSAYRGEAGWTTETHLLDGQRTDAGMVRAAIRAHGSAVLVAEAGGHLVGCCQLERRPDAEVYFGMFSVRPGRQGQGRGRLAARLLCHHLSGSTGHMPIPRAVGRWNKAGLKQALGLSREGAGRIPAAGPAGWPQLQHPEQGGQARELRQPRPLGGGQLEPGHERVRVQLGV